MSKSILVMDMPEQVCYKCSLCYKVLPVGDYYMCTALGKEIPDGEIPDWCPLRELPEKIPELKAGYEDISTSIRRVGWNACLDAIAKE